MKNKKGGTLLQSISVNSIFAESNRENTQEVQNKNLAIIKQTEDYLEYTYEEDGTVYKVSEKIKHLKNSMKIKSKVYKKNGAGNFEKVETITTETGDNEISIEKQKANKQKEREILSIPKEEFLTNYYKQDSGDFSISSVTPGDGGSDWKFIGTFQYSDWVSGLTIGGISALLMNRIPKLKSADAVAIASVVYDTIFPKDRLYYTLKEYHKYDGPRITAVKREVWMYNNSARTDLVEESTVRYPIRTYEYFY